MTTVNLLSCVTSLSPLLCAEWFPKHSALAFGHLLRFLEKGPVEYQQVILLILKALLQHTPMVAAQSPYVYVIISQLVESTLCQEALLQSCSSLVGSHPLEAGFSENGFGGTEDKVLAPQSSFKPEVDHFSTPWDQVLGWVRHQQCRVVQQIQVHHHERSALRLGLLGHDEVLRSATWASLLDRAEVPRSAPRSGLLDRVEMQKTAPRLGLLGPAEVPWSALQFGLFGHAEVPSSALRSGFFGHAEALRCRGVEECSKVRHSLTPYALCLSCCKALFNPFNFLILVRNSSSKYGMNELVVLLQKLAVTCIAWVSVAGFNCFHWSRAFPLYGHGYDSVLKAIDKMEESAGTIGGWIICWQIYSFRMQGR
ncbi:hypothetical protein NE237_021001 [Protea cynaroides]|uniref:Cell morphogenesis protein C-terminal domain-containing protein n=1 Tax=Protea cynaroides TaxID=273540 RepID=A0A9Q0H9J0_9MAGN|nr:hypothetical protein NE237_021001 [Protea cynaroides]